jgi:hypothetical protein
MIYEKNKTMRGDFKLIFFNAQFYANMHAF